ncbi:hypothetical protein PHMEG_00021452, partial [Phytophthora megakarya]
LSSEEAESLIHSLAGIPGGRPLIQAILETFLANSNDSQPPVANPPPIPDQGGNGSRNSNPPRRHPSDGMAERYDNEELIAYTKVIINSQVKLTKLHTKGDYKAWRSEVPLYFDSRMLRDITYGPERYDEQEGLHEIRDNMNAAAMLYERITQHFEADDGINPDYLLLELVTRKLQPNEAVTNYVDDIARKVTQLHQANSEFTEWQHASLLLSNCVGKFQDLAHEHGDWINNNDRKSLTLAEELQRLRAAEHQRAQLRVQTRQTALQGVQVANINVGQGQGQGYGRGLHGGRKRSQKQRKRSKDVADRKQHSACENGHGEGHWYSECTEKTGIPLRADLAAKLAQRKKMKSQQTKQPVSLVNSVRRVEVVGSGQHGLSVGLCQPSSSADPLISRVMTTKELHLLSSLLRRR